jgi:hypothetical protein
MRPHNAIVSLSRTRSAIVAVFLTGCASIGNLKKTLDPPDWREHPQHRTATEVENVGRTLTAESIRIVKGETSDRLTRATVWQFASWVSDPGPAPVRPFAQRLLQQAYAKVPSAILQNVVWQDRYPSLASGDFGVLINKERATELTWFVDSATLPLAPRGRTTLVREPGDFALLMLISHEMAHLAIDAASLAAYPESVIECTADVIAGFQTSVVSTRISSRGLYELEINGAVDALSRATLPGEWISRDFHPDNEQRGACLHRGIAMYGEQLNREPIAGSMLLHNARDSLLDSLSRGKTTLVLAAIAEARSVLSLPGEIRTPAPARATDPRDLPAIQLLSLTDTLLRRLAFGNYSSVIGEPIAVGVSLFPGSQLNELLLKVDPPWKCAVISGGPDIGRSIGCYVLGDNTDAIYTRLNVVNALQSDSLRLGFRVLSIGPATPTNVGLHLRQWLLVANSLQVLVSVYDELYVPNPYAEEHSDLRVLWFSFSDLSPVPKGKGPHK